MYTTVRLALVVAGVLLLVSLVYTRVDSAPVHSITLQKSSHVISIRGNAIRVSIANTEKLRAQGLSGRTGLASDEGMLFIFPKEGMYAFWMKDMLFSIDIVWIASDGTIVDMYEHVSPDTYPRAFMPQKQARYVLELPSNYIHAHGIMEGDVVM